MVYRSLGRTGVMVSPVCLGTMNFGGVTPEAEAIEIINTAIEAGINFIDTANVYSAGESENVVGKALKQNAKRADIILATKLNGAMGNKPNQKGGSRLHIMQAVEDSLRRLQTDYIDLYQLHRPNFNIPQDETLRAFDDLIRQGKVRYIGCSTHPAWYVMESLMLSERYNLPRYICEQPPYSLLDRRIENELIPLCEKYGMAIIPWAPLAGGILAGRYPVGQAIAADTRLGRTKNPMFEERLNKRGQEIAGEVEKLAKERNMTISQLSLLWAKDQPAITSPIVGPRTLDQLKDVLPVLEMTLNDNDRPLFDALVPPGSAIADFYGVNNWMKMKLAW
jgi:aryl-alcohol dehydrogenase-like predicted oxidoreductase